MPKAERYVTKGIRALEKDRFDQAIAFFHKSNGAAKNKDAYFGLAVCHHNLGKYADARFYAKLAAELGSPEAGDYLRQTAREGGQAGVPRGNPPEEGRNAPGAASGLETSPSRPTAGAAWTEKPDNSPQEAVVNGVAKSDMRLFIQKKSGFYIDKFERIEQSQAMIKASRFSLRYRLRNSSAVSPGFKIYMACAFFGVTTYCLYRKMYLIALASFLFNAVLFNYLPKTLASLGSLAIAPSLILLYRWHVTRKIKAINKLNLTEQGRIAKLIQEGGVNKTLAVINILIVIATIAAMIWLKTHFALPHLNKGFSLGRGIGV